MIKFFNLRGLIVACYFLAFSIAPFPLYNQRPIDQKTIALQCTKVYGYDYTSRNFGKAWVKRFDPDFKFYEKNEFELNKKISDALVQIRSRMESLEFSEIYTLTATDEFGNYDFDAESFEFSPLAHMDGDRVMFCRGTNFFNDLYLKGVSSSSSNIFAWNHLDFNGLPVKNADAEALIDQRTKQGYSSSSVNRKVYLKMYFSILNEKIQFENYYPRETQDRGLYCYVYKMEVWEDECMYENKIATIEAKQSPPQYLAKAKEDFDKKYPDGFEKDLTLEPGWIKLVDKKLIKRKSSGNCQKVCRFEIHLLAQESQNDLIMLIYKIRTNACVNFSPGFLYTLIDKNGKEYPLITQSSFTNKEDDFVLATVVVNRTTLTMISNSGLAGIKFQFSPTYQNPGIAEYINNNTKSGCTSLDYSWVSWTTLKNESEEYWMDNAAFENFKTIIDNVLK